MDDNNRNENVISDSSLLLFVRERVRENGKAKSCFYILSVLHGTRQIYY